MHQGQAALARLIEVSRKNPDHTPEAIAVEVWDEFRMAVAVAFSEIETERTLGVERWRESNNRAKATRESGST
ncbi:MAG TPA: hypothetical protein VF039_09450 [Longimicrobiales bacterium]